MIVTNVPTPHQGSHAVRVRLARLILASCVVLINWPLVGQVCVAPPPGLVSWWTGDVDTLDLTGANNPSATHDVSLGPGKVGNGFSIAHDGYIDVPDSPILQLQQFTLEAWVRPDGLYADNGAGINAIFGHNLDGFTDSAFLLWLPYSQKFVFVFGNTTTEAIVSQNAFPPGSFYHVAATYDGRVFRLFVNGVEEAQLAKSKAITYNTLPWTIGSAPEYARLQGYSNAFKGIIDEATVYNRALSQPEILSIVQAGSAGKCKVPLALTTVTPTHGGNSGKVTVTLYGINFQAGSQVKLTGGGQLEIWGQNTTLVYSGVMTTTFDLSGAVPGIRNVVLTNPDSTSATLPGAFTVEQGGAPDVTVSLIGRNVMRGAQSQTYFINLVNNGNVDAGQTRVWLAFPNYVQWQATTQMPSSTGQLNGTSYLAFEVMNVGAASSVAIPILLTAPDNPIYAHQRFQVQVWKEW